jgi:hypothetical protein
MVTSPAEQGRLLAPISAMLCGRNNASKLRVDKLNPHYA